MNPGGRDQELEADYLGILIIYCAKFEDELKCNTCGAFVDFGDLFCMNCGNNLKENYYG